jgi:hypothetical protein
MRWYQLLGLVAILAGVAAIGIVKTQGSRAASAPAAAPCDCTLPAKPTGASTTKAPAIPTGSGLPCLVEFGVGTCAECKKMAKVLDALAPTIKGKVDLVRLDTDAYPQEAQHYRLRMIPTQILVDAHSKELWRHEGFLSTADLRKMIGTGQ